LSNDFLLLLWRLQAKQFQTLKLGSHVQVQLAPVPSFIWSGIQDHLVYRDFTKKQLVY